MIDVAQRERECKQKVNKRVSSALPTGRPYHLVHAVLISTSGVGQPSSGSVSSGNHTHLSSKADIPSLLKMDPFQLQIIAENPIGNGLDSFQEKFRPTCAELGIPASAEAVRQVVENGENIELAAKLSLTVRRQQRSAI